MSLFATLRGKTPLPSSRRVRTPRRPKHKVRALQYESLEQRQLLSVTILGADGRSVVNQPDEGLNRAVGQLEIWFPRNPNPEFGKPDGLCSGVMISRRHVLTSAHCFYDDKAPNAGVQGKPVGDQARSIAFTPAREGQFGRPFGTAFAVNLRTYDSFKSTQDPKADVALVTLDRNLGDTVGWFGASAFSDSSYPRNVNVQGYPGTESGKFNGFTMVHQYDQAFISQAGDRFLRSSRIESEGGQSGSPWFNYNSDTKEVRVLGVMRGGDGFSQTAAVRLTSSMIDDFREAIDADLAGQTGGGGGSGRGFIHTVVNPGGTDATVDLPDLTDYDQWFATNVSGVSSTFVRAGDFFGASAWVQNIGTANAGPFTVSFFASPDPSIDAFDAFLGSTQVFSLSSFQSVSAQFTTVFPNLPAGQYFIGWIIDSGNAQGEFSETNNTGIFRGGPITVGVQNQAPLAADDFFSVEQGAALSIFAPGVLGNDFDPNFDFLQAFVETEPAHGVLEWNGVGGFVYTPNSGYQGFDSFTYRAGDGQLLSNLATVTLEVLRGNTPPLAAPDQATTRQEQAVLINILANDQDVDGELDAASVLVTVPPLFGEATIQPDGQIRFVPAEGFSGEVTFSYSVADDQGRRSNEATITVVVEPLNAPPAAMADNAATAHNRAVTVNVLANDSDTDGQLDASSVIVTTPPASGAATVQPDGQIHFTPANGFSGEVTFAYTVADDQGSRSSAALVTILVAPPPAWQNPQRPLDVNDDDSIDIGDLLPIVQYLRSDKPRALETITRDPADGYVDVNGDKVVSLADLLDVVTGVRTTITAQAAEGEADPASDMAPPSPRRQAAWTTAVDLIAADIAKRKKRF